MSANETRERILDVAERLFAEKGVDATSLREITQAAQVNLAAVNYHFGSKDGLIEAAFVRRVEPINRERVRLLQEYERAHQPPYDLVAILEIFIGPVFRASVANHSFDPLLLRLIGRLYGDPDGYLREICQQQYREVFSRHIEALMKALPGADRREVMWRLDFLIGITAHVFLSSEAVKTFTDGVCDPSNSEAVMERIIDFAAAGLRSLTRENHVGA